MKRIIALILALFLLTGCAAGESGPALADMLGTQAESTYTSGFGFAIDTAEMYVYSAADLAALNQVSAFTAEDLAPVMDSGSAVSIFSSVYGSASFVTLSLFPADGLPENVRTAADYAAYGLSVMPGKLEEAGYTDVQLQQVEVDLSGEKHPAVLCTAAISGSTPYYLLQICFQEGGWMGGLSLSSVESEDTLGALLSLITAAD